MLEIEVQGARQIAQTMPEAVRIFIAPPTEETLLTRLVGRGTDDPEEIERGSVAKPSWRRRTSSRTCRQRPLDDASRARAGRPRGPRRDLAGARRQDRWVGGPNPEEGPPLISPRVDRLLENVDSPYASVIVAAKRARQINSYYHNLGEGTFEEFPPPMVDTGSKNYLTIALEEVASGKVKYRYREGTLEPPTACAMARILLGVTGGIAAYKALELTRLAIKAGPGPRRCRRPASDALRRHGAAASSGCGGRTSASCGTTAASRRPGRSPTTSSSPTTPRPSISTRCTASGARTRPSRRPARPYRYPGGESRAADPAAERRLAPRLGCTPFHVPLGIMLDEQDRAPEPLHPLRHLRRPSLPGQAKSDAQVVCVDPALEYPNVTLLTGAYVSRLETNASGREVTRVLVERDGERETLHRPTSSWSPAGPSTPPRCCCARSSDRHPRGLANGSDVVGRHYMGHINSVLMALSRCPNPTVFQKTLGAERLLLRQPRTGPTRWATSRSWASWTGSRCRPARRRSRRAGRSTSWASTRSISGSPRRTCPIRRTG